MGVESHTSLCIGIDATRNRSGGAVAHIRGIISGSDPSEIGIHKVHLWTYDSLLQQVPDRPWLEKHAVPETKYGLSKQLWWQYVKLPRLLDQLRCNVVFNTDAGSVCPSRRSVTLSQDMLSFEPGEIQRYGYSKARIRLEVLKSVQAQSLKRARLAIYLTEYARKTVESQIGHTTRSIVIPHGIDEKFRVVAGTREEWCNKKSLQCLYVSNAAPYKHQWHVIEAIANLRRQDYPLTLTLVGGGSGSAQERLNQALAKHDPERNFAIQLQFIPNDEIPNYLAKSDLFIFASSCENLPITLLEAMASGIPICSSNRGPMPEVLGDGGCYFDPENPASIAQSVKTMIDNAEFRQSSSVRSVLRSMSFTWEHCSRETWKALASVCI